MRHDLGALNRLLAARIDALVPRFFSAAKRDGHYWRLGDIGGAPGVSLAIWRTGPKRGQWADFAAGTGGDPLSLVVHAFGGDFRKALDWAVEWTGARPIDAEPLDRRRAREARQAEDAARQARRDAEAAQRQRRAAKALFLSGAPLAGTPADAYLRGRNIRLASFGRDIGALRYHPQARDCTGRLRPCLMAAVVDGGGFLSVHRHFLHELADGRVVKADHGDVPLSHRLPKGAAKQAYVAYGGGMIPIWRGGDGLCWRDRRVAGAAIAAEGIEDALSWAMIEPASRVCASVALGNMGAMWLPPGIRTVLWHRHRGDGPSAQALYQGQAQRLAERGVTVKDLWAPDGAKDVNDWLREQGAAS